MIGRIVEIAEDRRRLSVLRGFLIVSDEAQEIGRVPLDDIAVLLINAHGCQFSANLVLALTERGAALVLCGPNHSPAAVMWPVAGHHLQTARMRAQLEMSKTTGKRLWAQIVTAKIRAQAAVLEAVDAVGAAALITLAKKMRSGDPENLEAQAARRYWQNLLGPEFRRDPAGAPPNGLLNYGYAVLRGATARAVLSSGLHPTLGLFHANQFNPMGLVDDLMEPFRPAIDAAVLRLIRRDLWEVTPETKPLLAGTLHQDWQGPDGAAPLLTGLNRLAASLAQVYLGERPALEIATPLPLTLAMSGGS